MDFGAAREVQLVVESIFLAIFLKRPSNHYNSSFAKALETLFIVNITFGRKIPHVSHSPLENAALSTNGSNAKAAAQHQIQRPAVTLSRLRRK